MELRILEDSVLKKPTSELWLQLGNIHHILGNTRHALLCTRKSCSLDPASLKCVLSLGLIIQNNLLDAERLYDTALQYHPRNSALAHRMAENLQKQGKLRLAQKYVRMAADPPQGESMERDMAAKTSGHFEWLLRKLNTKVTFVTLSVFVLVYTCMSSTIFASNSHIKEKTFRRKRKHMKKST